MEEVERTGILRRSRTWKSLKDSLALIGCCASPWRPSHPTTLHPNHDEDELEGRFRMSTYLRREHEAAAAAGAVDGDIMPASPSMSLAMALAAERQFRAAVEAAEAEAEEEEEEEEEEEVVETPVARVSLMRLLEEGDDKREESMRAGGGGEEEWWCCCVCMRRKKGAAFIPCGHTFCRVCCRELWLNRRHCPLCNRAIIDILDIF